MATTAEGSVLVTGGAGFIGTNLVRQLVLRQQAVVALDNEYLGRLSNLDGVECTVVGGDVLTDGLVDRLVTEHGVDRIVHLSGFTSAPMFAEDARGKILVNTEGFLNTLEAARAHDLTVAYASTSSFYARCPKPFREDMLIVPATPYELSKFVMEQAAHTYWHEYGVRANGLRFFSVYGPHEEHKTRYANNISQFFWSIQNGVRPVVFGDGTQTRDFTYVGDLVDGIIRVLDKGAQSDVYNIGTGTEHSFNDMIKAINTHLGTSVEPIFVQNPLKNYVQETLADTSKIRQEIGWEATTSLAEGIARIAEAGGGLSRAEAEALYDWLPTQDATRPG
jgi:UDP-glucose 4-epimerase